MICSKYNRSSEDENGSLEIGRNMGDLNMGYKPTISHIMT